MQTEVSVRPYEVWEYFQNNKKVLEEKYHRIFAGDKCEVWITNDDDILMFVVDMFAIGEEVSYAYTKEECEKIAEEYLNMCQHSEQEDEEFEAEDDEKYRRADGVFLAAYDFLETIFEAESQDGKLFEPDEEQVEGLLKLTAAWLQKEYNIDIEKIFEPSD